MANLKDLLVNGVSRFIGKVYAPTPEAGDNSTQVATTAFVMENAGTSSYHPTLFDFKYSDKLINDIQWLRADTFSWQTGGTNGVYQAAYAKLLEEYNDSSSTAVTEGTVTYKLTPSGFKIADSTQEDAILTLYNTTGVAWYYIIDTTNSRFKLPRSKFGFTGFRDEAGKYVPETLPKLTTSGTPVVYVSSGGATALATGSTTSVAAGQINNIYRGSASDPVQERATQMYLYFYVGEYTQTATQQTAGLNTELFNNKLDLNMANMAPTSTVKNTITTWGMPDYSAGVTYANNTTVNTAPSNGVLVISYYVNAQTTGYFKINGKNIAANFHTSVYGTMVTGQYMLSKGDTFQITSVGAANTSIPFIYEFYPLKAT